MSTKRKVRVDPGVRTASFSGERISIIRQADTEPVLVQLRLIAYYNGKDKAIGLCNVDLSAYIGKAVQSTRLGF